MSQNIITHVCTQAFFAPLFSVILTTKILIKHSIALMMNNKFICPHSQSIQAICAQANCLTPLCAPCLSNHQKECKHAIFLHLNQASTDFFIEFTQYLVHRLNQWVAIMSQSGLQMVFSIRSSSLICYNLKEISNHAFKILKNYIVLLQNNISYVTSNRNNPPKLRNGEFIKDISEMILLRWEFIAHSICQHIKTDLNNSYPYRYSYRNIQITCNASFVLQIQEEKQKRLALVRQKVLVSYETVLQELSHRQVQAKVSEHIRNVSQNFKFVDSFQQILEGSYSFSMNDKHVLDQSLQETFSPYHPQQDLERHLQDLLIENERLKQQNLRIRFENKLLTEENMQLRRRI